MLGRLESLRELQKKVQDGVKELGAAAVNEARDALKEGQALARAAAKSREQSVDVSGGWEVGGFSIDATDPESAGNEEVEFAAQESAEIGELLAQLKAAETPENEEKPPEEPEKPKKQSKKGPKKQAKPPQVDSAVQSLVPELENRLSSLQERIVILEERGEKLAESKEKVENELRESRIGIELVTVERDKLMAQLKERENALSAAQALAAEREAAFQAEASRSAELAERMLETKVASTQEQEDTATRWQAKVIALSAEIEKLKAELKESAGEISAVREGQEQADVARAEAEAREQAAEQRAIAAMNEIAQLKARSSQVMDQSEQMKLDNERRSKSFNAAVEAQVQRFRASLEAERDAALAKVEDAHRAQAELQLKLTDVLAELEQAKEATEEQAALVVSERAKVAEYEQAVATMQAQVATAVATAEEASRTLADAEAQWEEKQAALENEVASTKASLDAALTSVKEAEESAGGLRKEVVEWRAAAKAGESAQLAASMAREEAETAIEESVALKAQVTKLKRELEAARSSITVADVDGVSPAASPSKEFSGSLPGTQSSLPNRESNSALPSFDLEALRRTPLLPTSTPAGRRGAASVGERRSSSLLTSTKQMVYAYMALVHLLLLFAMGRASHAHLACEHLHTAAGGLP